MPVLDTLLREIKKRCNDQKKMAEIYNFSDMARITELSATSLILHLEILQSQGLIRFSESPGAIYLTAKGRDWTGPVYVIVDAKADTSVNEDPV